MIIVDSSVVFKWLVAEKDDPGRIAWLLRDDYLSGNKDITAPDILLYEIANILAHKTELTRRDVKRLWRNFLQFEIPTIAPTSKFMSESLHLSLNKNLSVYDATYIILAKSRRSTLFTADVKLVNKMKLPFVRHLNTYTKT